MPRIIIGPEFALRERFEANLLDGRQCVVLPRVEGVLLQAKGAAKRADVVLEVGECVTGFHGPNGNRIGDFLSSENIRGDDAETA